MAKFRLALLALPLLALGACHREIDDTPMIDRKIYLTDRFFDVAAPTADRAIVVGYNGKILDTKDSGRSWTVVPSGVDEALYSVTLKDGKSGWIVGQGGTVLRTTDGGATWTPQTSGTKNYLFSVAALSPTKAVAVGDKSVILRTEDGGATWKATTFKPPASEAGSQGAEDELIAQEPSFYDVKFVDENTGWIVGEFGKILKTTDGGQTWKEQQGSLVSGEITNALDLPTFYGAHFLNAQEGVAAGLEGRIAHTTDGGQTWKFEEIDSENTEPLFATQVFPDGTGWAVGAAGEVLRREGPSTQWKDANLGTRLLSWMRGVEFVDPNNGWIVGGFGTILHTRDGGKTWIPTAA